MNKEDLLLLYEILHNEFNNTSYNSQVEKLIKKVDLINEQIKLQDMNEDIRNELLKLDKKEEE